MVGIVEPHAVAFSHLAAYARKYSHALNSAGPTEVTDMWFFEDAEEIASAWRSESESSAAWPNFGRIKSDSTERSRRAALNAKYDSSSGGHKGRPSRARNPQKPMNTACHDCPTRHVSGNLACRTLQ